MLPWPLRTAVVVCALAGFSPWLMELAVAAGRVVPATAYAAIGAYAPSLLRKIASVDRIMRNVEKARQEA